jgi:hypothetical protein
MPPYDKRLLEETLNLSQENNKILRRLQRSARISQFFSLLKWLIIIALTVGTYYYVQPYLDSLLKAYKDVGGSMPNFSALQESLKNFQGLNNK